jgi:hypothetical protein
MKYIESVQTVIKNNTSTRVLYVSSDEGNDANDGSLARPFLTIQAAINAAQSFPSTLNTPIIIKIYPSKNGGTYNENLSITQQGITLESFSSLYKSDSVQITGTITVNLSGTAGGGNFVASENNCYLKGLVVSGGSGNSVYFTGLAFQRLFISNCVLESNSGGPALLCDNGVVLSGSVSTITLRDCDISNSSLSVATISLSTGKIFMTGSNPSITNSTSGGMAFNLSGTSSSNLTLNNGSVTGLYMNSGSALSTFTNTTFTGTTTGGILTLSSTGSVTLGACSIVNTTSTGSGINNAGGTYTVIQTLFNIGTGTGAYAAKGTGVYAYALNIFISNTKQQSTLTNVALATAPTIVA